LRRSARLGYAEAEYALGLAYAQGSGVEKDASQAYGWLLKAAKQGHPAAKAYVKDIQTRVLGAPVKGGDAANPASTPRAAGAVGTQ